jgi:hypothetical protein
MNDQNPEWKVLGAFVQLAEALAILLTLGLYCPNWHVRFLLWKLSYLFPVIDEEE